MTAADPPEDIKVHLMDAATRALLENARKVPRVSKKIRKRQQHWVRVPWLWIERLEGVRSGHTYRLALVLLYLHWKGNGEPIKLPNGMLSLDGISRQVKWCCLARLEQLGLVVVERRFRKSPIVKLNLSK
jgi:hypothetical protein